MKQFWIKQFWWIAATVAVGSFHVAYMIGERRLVPYLHQRSIQADERAYNSVAACTGATVPVSCKEGR